MECPKCLKDPCVCNNEDLSEDELDELEEEDSEGQEDICSVCWKEPCECDQN